MRVNVYAEEMTDRVEIIAKEIDGHRFTGLRFYLELPCTVPADPIQGAGGHPPRMMTVRGPFIHRPGDDDSGAVTFWGKRDLRGLLRTAIARLAEHYGPAEPSAIDDVLLERIRQINAEGFTADHDDEHGDGALARAAACYILNAERIPISCGDSTIWPWDKASFKPKDRRRDLVRAAALLIAEIERVDRSYGGWEGA